MNKIININLGGIPFIIDENAYEHVNKYLRSIRNHFAKSEGCEEILYDIEVRMAELFLEKLKTKQIITQTELNAVIETMGRPEDFGAEPISETKDTFNTFTAKPGSDYKYIKTGKRLFRDPDDKIIGGVCSGIAAYLGIDDPVFVRVIFAILFFTFGVGFLAYIVLMIIMPKATSAGDKLAMRGEPINVENIAKTIEQEIDELSHKLNEFGKEIGSKKKDHSIENDMGEAGHKDGFIHEEYRPKRTSVFNFVGDAIDGTARVGKWSIKAILTTIAAIILGVLVLFWSSGIIGYIMASPMLRYFGSASDSLYSLGSISLMLIVLLPIMGLILLLARIFIPGTPRNEYKGIMALTWFLAIGGLSVSAAKTAKEYQSSYQNSTRLSIPDEFKEIRLEIPDIDTKLNSLDYESPQIHFGDDFFATEDELLIKNVRIKIEKSADDKFYIDEKISARGMSSSEARTNVERMGSKMKLDGNKIVLPGFVAFTKGELFRDQKYSYTIYVPKDRVVLVDSEASNGYIWADMNLKVEDDGNTAKYSLNQDL